MIPSSIPAGDAMVGSTPTVSALRARYSEAGGPLTPRRRRFLRRYVAAYVDSSDIASTLRQGGQLSQAQRAELPAMRVAIILPRDLLVERAPLAIRPFLRQVFDLATVEWHLARPWIGDPDHRIPDALLDNEFGAALERADTNDWDTPPASAEPI